MHELQQLHGELDVAQPAPAELELALAPGRPLSVPSTLRRIAWTSSTKSGRAAADQTIGATAAAYAAPSAASPATGRALSRAWNSHVRAHRR